MAHRTGEGTGDSGQQMTNSAEEDGAGQIWGH